MSANEVLITARNPYCVSAQGACSRELPQPKLSPASNIWHGFRLRFVQNEIRLRLAIGVVAPVAEKLIAQAVFRNGLQESRRDDLIGIDVVARDHYHAAFERSEFFHYSSSLTSLTLPVMAEAAAVIGLARNVRPPLPCRPSKLRLLVDTLYSPGCN